mmetsp:Transcript_30251/g.85300  ORF Transcript_30251/g.85300 Transcript_30251/m.85300 type:complete len:376 (+) Transcript_30251:76-1203(+)
MPHGRTTAGESVAKLLACASARGRRRGLVFGRALAACLRPGAGVIEAVLLGGEAAARGGRDLHHDVLAEGDPPGLLDGHAAEVRHQELQDRQVGHDEHRVGTHFDLQQHALQALEHIHVALAPREAAPQRVPLQRREEVGVALLDLLPGGHVALALDVPPPAADGALVHRVQRGGLLMPLRHVADRLGRAGHGARDHIGRGSLLPCTSPVSLCALPDEGCQGHREAGVGKFRQPVPVGALRVRLASSGADQPDGPRADVDRHQIRQNALRYPAVALVRHHLARQVDQLDRRGLVVPQRLVHLLVLGYSLLEVSHALLQRHAFEIRAMHHLSQQVDVQQFTLVAHRFHEEDGVVGVMRDDALDEELPPGGRGVCRV